jgi:hypothetical protein
MHQKSEISKKKYTLGATSPVRGNRAQTTKMRDADGDAIRIFGHSDDNHPACFGPSDSSQWYPR